MNMYIHMYAYKDPYVHMLEHHIHIQHLYIVLKKQKLSYKAQVMVILMELLADNDNDADDDDDDALLMHCQTEKLALRH